jgi:adenosine deaminase
MNLDTHTRLSVKRNERFSDEFLAAMPKCDLHTHLDGGVRLQTVVDLAAEQEVKLPAEGVAGLKEKVFLSHYDSLEEYLQCFGVTGSCLHTPDALRRVAYEFAKDSFDDNVIHVEVRFAPQLHATKEMGIDSVLRVVNEGCAKACDEYNAHEDVVAGRRPKFGYGIIVCALRMIVPQMSAYYENLFSVFEHVTERRVVSAASYALVVAALHARDHQHIPIVALDIAGAEDGYPPQVHKEAFDLAHKYFLNKTVHASEGFGPESLFRAITDCHAERIGHGFHIFSVDRICDSSITDRDEYVRRLSRYVADQRITLEVSLTSNIHTMPELTNIRDHAMRKMLDMDMSVAISTDNRTVSDTTLTAEFRLAVDAFELTPKQLKNLVITAFKRSFYPGSYKEKRKYLAQVIEYYEQLEKQHGVV